MIGAMMLALMAGVFAAQGQAPPTSAQPQAERHLTNVRQLTSGGENAEAYFSPDGRQLIYQTNPGTPGTCDQIFHDERRRLEQAPNQQGRSNHVRLLLS